MHDDEDFNIWLVQMWTSNREERLDFKEGRLSFEDYCKTNMYWLEEKYKELKKGK